MTQEEIERIEKELGKILEIGEAFTVPMRMADGTERATKLTTILVQDLGLRTFNHTTGKVE